MARISHGWNAGTGIVGWIALALWLLFATQVDAGSTPSNASPEFAQIDSLCGDDLTPGSVDPASAPTNEKASIEIDEGPIASQN